MHAPIGIAFIGAGRVADNHYRAVKRCEGAVLVGIFDVDAERADRRAREWQVHAYSSLDDLFSDPKVTAVFVLTPVEHHFTLTVQALRAGKHVLVEKPVSLQVAEVEQIMTTAKETGRVCVPGHSYLYLPEIRRMRRHVEEKVFGRLCHMEMKEIYRMPESLIVKYRGVLEEVLCHPIYTMLHLLGRPTHVCCFASSFREELFPNRDEHVVAMAAFDNGAIATLMVSWALEDETSDPWTFKIKLLGTDGGATFSRKDAVTGTQARPPWEYPMYDESFEREVDFFVNRCIKRGEKPLSDLNDAADTARVLDAVKRSIANRTVEPIVW